jgi:Dolichyl-phosphate-mannose-protein mannosyltransferase
LVSILGLGLRLWGYTSAPGVHDNPDDAQFAWAGLSLLQRHLPVSWSFFTDYPSRTFLVTHDGLRWPLVQPWLDQPPLFPLLIGGASWLGGVRGFVDDAVWIDRLPVVLLGAVSVPLLHLLGRRLLGRPSLLATTLYATGPGAVLFSRAVEPEAVLAVLLLLSLLALHRIGTGEAGRWSVVVLLGCCAVAPLFKVPGVAVGGIAAVVLVQQGRLRLAAAAVGAAVLGLLGFFAYGAAYDWNLFWAIWNRQSAQRVGVLSGLLFVTAPAGVNRLFHDGWWLFGWLGVGALLAGFRRGPRMLLLAWPILAYAAAMLVMADNRVNGFGWYRITVYPLVYLAAGHLLWLAWRSASPAVVTAVAVFGGAAAAYPLLGGTTFLGVQSATFAALPIGILVLVAAIAAARTTDPHWRRARRAVGVAFGALLLAGNVAVSLSLPQDYLKL